MEQLVYCPYCNAEIHLDTPPADVPVVCPKCGEKSEWWADGDIGSGAAYYLTKIAHNAESGNDMQPTMSMFATPDDWRKAREEMAKAGASLATIG